jgi:hypothetical protein
MKKEELELEKRCCDYARKLGIASVKLEKNQNKGIQDRLFIKKGGECFFVEFKKSEKENPTDNQVFWHEYIGKDRSAIIWNFDDFCSLDFFDTKKIKK